MNKDLDVSRHCSRGNLRDRLNAALAEDGIDPSHPSIEAEIANQLEIDASDQILDIGSGIGGPTRYFAHRFGCEVTGVDLTAEFCDVARDLTRALGLERSVTLSLAMSWRSRLPMAASMVLTR